MIHFTCDVCRREMVVGDKDRYVVHVEIRPADDSWELTEEDIDDDNLEKVSKLLQQSEETGLDPYDDSSPVRIRFDLCSKCRGKFLRNPLNCQPVAKFNFSEN